MFPSTFLILGAFFVEQTLKQTKFAITRKTNITDVLSKIVKGANVFIAYDWDLTLKVPGKNGPVTRGSDETRNIIRECHHSGVRQVIVSATRPSLMNWSTLAHEVKTTGLSEFFNVDAAPEERKLHNGSTIVIGGDLCLSGYCKPEAVEFLKNNAEHILFFDDFVVNAFSIGEYFAGEDSNIEGEVSAVKSVHSCWLDPTDAIKETNLACGSENSYSADYECYRKPVTDGLYFNSIVELRDLLVKK